MEALIGLAILIVTAVLFWRVLPRNGKTHRLVGTEWEPYFVILFVMGASLGFGLVAVWTLDALI
jgi:hypothetical protein